MIPDSPATRVQPKWKFHDDYIFAKKVRVEMSIALQYFGTVVSMSSWDPGYGTLPLQKKQTHVPFEARHRAWSSTEAVPIPTPSSKSSGCLFWHWQLMHWALKEKVRFTPWKIKGWNLQITHLERKMIFQTSMIRFHVNLQGCNVGTVDGRNRAFTGWYGKFTASTDISHKLTLFR